MVLKTWNLNTKLMDPVDTRSSVQISKPKGENPERKTTLCSPGNIIQPEAQGGDIHDRKPRELK